MFRSKIGDSAFIQLDVVTRWTSTFRMIKLFLKSKVPLEELLNEIGQKIVFSQSYIKALIELEEILRKITSAHMAIQNKDTSILDA